MSIILDLVLIVVLCGLVNTMLGTFLVLRESSLVSFGLAHSILLGIVLAYIVTNDLSSPFLIVGAAISGVVIVILIEKMQESRFIKYDAALGVTYLTIFALGIIALTQYANDTTLSLNSVVSGQILFAPFVRMTVLGINLPTTAWVLGGLLVINVVFLVLFQKELILTSFDPNYARVLGIDPSFINYLLMGLVSLTIVGSYTAVGAILVVAFMIAPGATATLFSKDLRTIMALSLAISISGALTGLWIAIQMDLSIAGTISTLYGMIFVMATIVGPGGFLRSFARRNSALRPPPDYIIEHGGK